MSSSWSGERSAIGGWGLTVRRQGVKGVRAAVLTGSGDQAFCAGGDVSEFAKRLDDVDVLVKEMTTYLHAAVSRFAWMRAPLIGAVNGVAAGAGLSAVAFCDLVIAADHATFTSAYTQIGLTPDGSSTYFLNRILGPRRAMELYLTNRVLSAEEALDWGLVNKVVAADQLRGEAEALAASLAKGPTRAAQQSAGRGMPVAGPPNMVLQVTESLVRRSSCWDGG